MMERAKIMAVTAVVFLCVAGSANGNGQEIDFARDIRPILSDRCFKCHGFDDKAREGDLALHSFALAIKDGAIVPGDADASEIMFRIITDDRSEMMPPPKANKPALTKEEIEKFRKWIDQGAKYEEHWAFRSPRETKIAVKTEEFRNPIDAFIENKLKEKGLEMAGRADAYTLLRRLSLDLTGLPPTPAETETFVEAYQSDARGTLEKTVDNLLKRPEYGEKWARDWLDLARYSDTNGYEKDRERPIWPYRDWVIHALNEDKPYDQFSIEQLAGDMLPDATLEQKIATGFHRNTMLNEEGGIDPLEFRYLAMVDRVATTGTVWLGLTTGCAQCHTHKFDPITHTDFYSMMALLNNADEPAMDVPSEALIQQKNQVQKQIDQLEKALVAKIDPVKYFHWYRETLEKTAAWQVLKPVKMKSSRPHLSVMHDGSIFATGDFTKREVYDLEFDISGIKDPVTAIRIEPIPDKRLPGHGSGIAYYEGHPGDFFLSEVETRADGRKLTYSSGSVDYGKIATGFGTAVPGNVYDGDATSGWATAEQENKRHELVLNFQEPVTAKALQVSLLFQRHFAAGLGRFRISVTTDKGTVLALGGAIPDLVKARGEALMRHYVRVAPEFEEGQKELESLEKQIPKFPQTLVMQEWDGRTRPTHRHHRGEYLQPKEEVSPAIPVIFGKLPEHEPANRLTFAKWLVSDANPLAARVVVNRAWRSFFGRGIVNTAGDYGYQSELPSHPGLLDFLSVKLMDEGWSLKNLHRLIVISDTYLQDSTVTPESYAADPENIYLSRGPRFRMTGEMIRDCALHTSGLLTQQIGGPSVRPPQPETVTTIAYGAPKWTSDEGPDRYRRSLYTLHKRTAPFAAYLTFDGPTGESCLPRRNRSNTPLQALTLMNDPMFIEAARAMARGVEGTDEEIVTDLFRKIVSRTPHNSERTILVNFYRNQRGRLELLRRKSEGEGVMDPELTAWTLVVRAIFNLDEAVVKG
ncbi:MAG: PSD1 and planctomycete cytochrome C domain-containing protein [Verrucomicrobiales bacterium]|nr:PSD1 and planctomycete cytochrome C domain-containing protein [Verrucomicrobiales bacterium]